MVASDDLNNFYGSNLPGNPDNHPENFEGDVWPSSDL